MKNDGQTYKYKLQQSQINELRFQLYIKKKPSIW